MRKNNIRILVQDSYEPGVSFAKRIEDFCECLRDQFKPDGYEFIGVSMTSSSDGRQTATIQFYTGK